MAGGGLTLALTSGTGSSSTAAAPTGPAEMTDSVTIADFDYDPPAIQVSAGTEVSITNSDAAAHTITADDESFDSGTIDGGAEGSVAFEEPGTYEYFCRFHVFMKGTVEVK
ncbi:MAG: cupredoxin domain-containing protein [Solirubrobacterales bacterium]